MSPWTSPGKRSNERKPHRWYHYIVYFFGGVFLINCVPHLVAGVSGNPFPSRFASPPGEGLSSSTVNVLWATFNLVMAYLLLCRTGNFDLRKTKHVIPFGFGAIVTKGKDRQGATVSNGRKGQASNVSRFPVGGSGTHP